MRNTLKMVALVFGLMAGGSAKAEDNSRLAITFAYSPASSGAELAAGYKKHLEWHAERNDPILWYAWFVLFGDRIGHFVDGAFDVTGAEFDARIDPAGDAADAIANFMPHAKSEYRRLYRLREDLSTSTFLEAREPSALMQVVYYKLNPGQQFAFEEAVKRISFAAYRESVKFTIYQMLTGSEGPTYMFVAPLTGMSGFDKPHASLEELAKAYVSGREFVEVRRGILGNVASSTAEVWQYRADLSLIPNSN